MSEEFETTIKTIAEHLPYPPTPPLHRPTRQLNPRRGWQRAAIVMLLVGLVGFIVPDIRAAVLTFLQIGVVRIDLEGTTETGQPLHLDDVSGETSLEDAQSHVMFPLLMSTDDKPDRVFVQDSLVIFVWIADGKIERALYQIPNYDWIVIKSATILSSTKVGSYDALWLDLQHPVEFNHDGETKSELTHFVTGHVLIWEIGQVTYRLETQLSLEDARHFAESLVVMSELEDK